MAYSWLQEMTSRSVLLLASWTSAMGTSGVTWSSASKAVGEERERVCVCVKRMNYRSVSPLFELRLQVGLGPGLGITG